MMMKIKQKQIVEMLDSDDELPSEYNDVLEVPAYENDTRFEPVKFRWIDTNFSKYYFKNGKDEKPTLSTLHAVLNENSVHKKTQNLRTGAKALIFNGVLGESDILCVNYLKPLTSDATLLWLLNFLIHKDLQAKFTFLKTCLVDDIIKNDTRNSFLSGSECKKFNFNIKIK